MSWKDVLGGGGLFKMIVLGSSYSLSSSVRKAFESLQLVNLLNFELRPTINIPNRTV
jgi:hypothetical protein